MIDNEQIRKHVSLAIFLERVNNRYSRNEVADAIGVTSKTLENIEKGMHRLNLETYLEICSFFHVGISYFLPKKWEQIRKEV